jgi:hemoglobin
MQIRSFLAVLTLVGLSGAAVTSAPATAQDSTKPLYDRLGGYAGVSAVVEEFGDRLFADPDIAQFFVGMGDDTRASFKQKNKNLVCAVTGGPCKVISRDADVVHNGLGITAADFDVVAGHLKDVLDEFSVPNTEQEELLAIIVSLRPAIVDRPDVTMLSKDAPASR